MNHINCNHAIYIYLAKGLGMFGSFHAQLRKVLAVGGLMSLLVFLIGVSPASAKEAESTSYSTLNEVLSPQEVHALENEFSPEELEAIERSINQGLAQAESGVYDGGCVGSLGAHVPMAPNGCTMSPDRWAQ